MGQFSEQGSVDSSHRGNPIRELLSTRDTLILDGALATELELRGCDLTDSLWSCKTLMEQPDLIEQVHLDYYLAGADIAITASYQASVKGLVEQKGLSEAEAQRIIGRSVTLANSARTRAEASFNEKGSGQDTHRRLLVAGSVGPYGAYLADGSEYRGDYKVSAEELRNFHRPRIQALVDVGVNLLACETMPSDAEITALADLITSEFPNVFCWFAFTLKDSASLSDGTPLQDVCQRLSCILQVVALGVNCVQPDLVEPALQHMSKHTHLPLVVYPNSGEVWNAKTRSWSAGDGAALTWVDQALAWKRAGARLIGGCCRTSPQHIRDLRDAFGKVYYNLYTK